MKVTVNTYEFIGAFDYHSNYRLFQQNFNHINLTTMELHKLFDIYNDYDGVNNVKTIVMLVLNLLKYKKKL